MALAQAKHFGFKTVSCSSTGNLANAVAAQAARGGFDAWIFIPADLEPAKVLGTHVFGAKHRAHRRQLRPGQSPLLADRRAVQLGLRQHQPAAVLRRRLEDGRLRNRRAARLAPARQHRRAHGRRLADHQDSQVVRRADRAGTGAGKEREILRRAGHRLLADLPRGERRARTKSIRRSRTPSRVRWPSAIPPTGSTPAA